MVQLADHLEVLAAGEEPVDGRVLRREPEAAAHGHGVAQDVVAGDVRRALVGPGQGGQDADGRGLAGAVRAEHRADGAARDVEVDTVECSSARRSA